MTAAILAILAALVPVVALLIKRHVSKVDDPTNENMDRKAQADRAIGRRDVDSINRLLNADLERLQDSDLGSTSRQGDKPPTGRPDAKGNQ